MSSDTILTAEDGTQYSWDNLASQKWLDELAAAVEQVLAAFNKTPPRLKARRP